MQRKRKGHILTIVLVALIVAIITVPMVVASFFLPSEVKVIAGKDHSFNFSLPLKAKIIMQNDISIKDFRDEEVKEAAVDLSKPLHVKMDTEGTTNVQLKLMGIIPLKTVSVQAVKDQKLIPCGEVVGIKVDTQGVLVLGIGEFDATDGVVSPCKGIVEVGDVILSCNGQKIQTKEEFRECVECANDAQKLKLEISRHGVKKQVEVTPCFSSMENEYKIGLWIKDSTQGIGTITYINPKSMQFGALGHGITDAQTHMLTPVRTGEIMKVFITRITKGEKGTPGELSGVIDYDNSSKLGTIATNKILGVYGKVEEEFKDDQAMGALPIAFQDEVHEGKAVIKVNLTGDKPTEYEVEIQKVSRFSSEPSKGMIIKIVDKDLLELTNGIIQGMSGSPIIQDGKLVGAVTHVFVHDPTRGYGIFIENMLNTE